MKCKLDPCGKLWRISHPIVTLIVHTTHNVYVDELSTYSYETDYDYIDEKWASKDNTLFASETEDSDLDNKVSTSKQKISRSVTLKTKDNSQNLISYQFLVRVTSLSEEDSELSCNMNHSSIEIVRVQRLKIK